VLVVIVTVVIAASTADFRWIHAHLKLQWVSGFAADKSLMQSELICGWLNIDDVLRPCSAHIFLKLGTQERCCRFNDMIISCVRAAWPLSKYD
jgi:hypothetical protein